MKKALGILLLVATALLAAAPASAQFGFRQLELGMSGTQAGIHPAEVTTVLEMESLLDEGTGLEYPDGQMRDLEVEMPAGFAGNPTAVPRCRADEFGQTWAGLPFCSNSTALGYASIKAEFDPVEPGAPAYFNVPVYNLMPSPGKAAKLGFRVLGVPVTIDVGVREEAPYAVYAELTNIIQAPFFFGSKVVLWGNPADPSHDSLRGTCMEVLVAGEIGKPVSKGKCQSNAPDRPFLTAPRSCDGPLVASFWGRAWNSGETISGTATAPARGGCSKLGFAAEAAAAPTTAQASSASGLSFDLVVDDEGLTSSKEGATAYSDIKRTTVTLPEGMTLNPAQAEGLAVCTEDQVARERAGSPFGAGCPAASKIGSVEVQTPLLEDTLLHGSLFVAAPYANPFDSLLALYMTIKDPKLGISVTVPAKVSPDPLTGQIVTTFGDSSASDPGMRALPQVPLGSVRVQLRGGARSPLVTPPSCGSHQTEALFTTWADPGSPHRIASGFQITSGPGGTSCPRGAAPPFEPGFNGGTVNNAAGSYSPFVLGLTRRDGDQDLVRFDATLPPGALAKLAGVSYCPDEAIASIKAKTGRQELASPSCPDSSKVGAVQAGAGVGSQLVYVPGSVYLAGPFGGAPLSVVGVVPAVAGPFDVGVVATRQALTVDPVTGVAKVDGRLSDPIPHILAGIPLKVRDIQVAVDRPEFTFNPTNCDPLSFGASIWGGGADPFSLGDDGSVARSQRFQAADCARLQFKPRLQIRLLGGAKRGDNPGLKAVLRPRVGDANLKRTVVKLPSSAFLEQGHIRTVCTRVQWAKDACPKGSIYGRVEAHTPLLDQPLVGNAYLRSSDNQLPDLVFDLRGIVRIEAAARIDSVRGGIRASFPAIPDAPISKVVVNMFGGSKGLIVNARNLCFKPKRNRAEVSLAAHNGRTQKIRPVVRSTGCKKKARR